MVDNPVFIRTRTDTQESSSSEQDKGALESLLCPFTRSRTLVTSPAAETLQSLAGVRHLGRSLWCFGSQSQAQIV
jgi:hypothetical protein